MQLMWKLWTTPEVTKEHQERSTIMSSPKLIKLPGSHEGEIKQKYINNLKSIQNFDTFNPLAPGFSQILA